MKVFYKYTSIICFCCIFLMISIGLNGQCLHQNLSLEAYLGESPTIIYGTVINKSSFFNSDQNAIFTRVDIKINRQFSGELSDTITAIYRGGLADGILELHTPSVDLAVGFEGVLLLADLDDFLEDSLFSSFPIYQLSVGNKSIIEWDKEQAKFTSVKEEFQSSKPGLFSTIEAFTGHSSKFLSIPDSEIINSTASIEKDLLEPQVLGFSPTTVQAGENNVLTISGSNFGASPGSNSAVLFRNPDFFGLSVSYQAIPPNHILSWSDSQIQIIVPGRDLLLGNGGAGSGKIRVRNNDGETGESDESLEVGYNKLSLNLREVDLVNDNNFGGYTLIFNEDFFANSAAVNATARSLETWQCAVQSNYILDAATSSASCPVNDGNNLISFDSNCPLPLGTLAQTIHWFEVCDNGDALFIEMDIIVSATEDWNFGPNPTTGGQKDFETLMLHEWGHIHGLGHALNFGKTMYPAVNNNSDFRTLDPTAIAGGTSVMAHSQEANECLSSSPVIPIPECNASPCLLNLDIIQNGVCANEELEYLLILQDVNGSEDGFEVLLNGSEIEGSPFSYDDDGISQIPVSVTANGAFQIFSIEDGSNPACQISQTIETPDCTCSIDAELFEGSTCQEGFNNFILNIDELNANSSFDVILDGTSIEGSPFNFNTAGPTIINFSIIADGQNHTIEIQDSELNTCSETLNTLSSECICNLSLNLSIAGLCSTNDLVPINIEIISINPSSGGFWLYANDVLLDPNPVPYQTTGVTTYSFFSSADGSLLNIEVVDFETNTCFASNSISLPNCVCFLNPINLNIGACVNNDQFNSSLNLNGLNLGGAGFSVLIDGIAIQEEAFDYSEIGPTNLSLLLNADGNTHSISVQDLESNFCSSSLNFTAPSCDCSISLESISQSNCSDSGTTQFDINFDLVNSFDSEFAVNLDGLPYPNAEQNIISSAQINETISIELLGDGAMHSIEIINTTNNSCSISIPLQSEFCNCSLEANISTAPICQSEQLASLSYTLVHGPNISESFSIFINDELHSSSVLYSSGSSTNLTLSILANNQNQTITFQDDNGLCTSSFQILSPNCACSATLNWINTSDCNASGTAFATFIANVINSQSNSLQVYLNGIESDLSPITINAEGNATFTLEMEGNGQSQTIEINDPLGSNCMASNQIPSPNCTCGLQAQISNNLCTGNPTETLLLEVSNDNPESNQFEVFIDGTPLDENPINYNIDGEVLVNTAIVFDGSNHEIIVNDLSLAACSLIIPISTLDCGCKLELIDLTEGDCSQDGFFNAELSTLAEFSASSSTYSIYLDGETILSNLNYNDELTTINYSLNLPADGLNHTISIISNEDANCSDELVFTSPICSCSINFSVLNSTDCNSEGTISYQVEISPNLGSENGFSVFLEDQLISENNIPNENGTLILDLILPGDGVNHIITFQDAENAECENHLHIISPDCTCIISAEANPSNNCLDGETEVFLTVSATNITSNYFQVLVDDSYLIDSLFAYGTDGSSIIVSISLPADGEYHSLNIFDFENENCSFEIDDILSPTCPCFIEYSLNSFSDCNAEGYLEYILLVSSQNGSSQGFMIYIDGEAIQEEALLYSSTNPTIINILIPGDGGNHSILVQDELFPDCIAETSINVSNCQCQLFINAIPISTCEQEMQAYQISVTSNFAEEILLQLDDEDILDGMQSLDQGMWTDTLWLNADGEIVELTVNDAFDIACTATTQFELPNCICELNLEAAIISDCQNNEVEILLNIISTNPISENFILQADGIEKGIYSYSEAGFQSLIINELANGQNINFQIFDSFANSCIASNSLQLPNCQTTEPTCQFNWKSVGLSDCVLNESGNLQLAFESNFNSSNQYQLIINGSSVSETAFNYHPSGLNQLDISLDCDTVNFQILLQDLSYPNCKIDTTLSRNILNPGFGFYPNPIDLDKQSLFIFGLNTDDLDDPLQWQLFDLNGRLLTEDEILAKSQLEIQISGGISLPVGIYFMRLKGSHNNYTLKLLIRSTY